MLGGPIGGGFQACQISTEADFNEKYVQREMTRAAEVLPKLALLRKFTSTLLARVCVNSRVTLAAGNTFDSKMDACIATAADYAGELPEVAQLIRGLATSEGGASMRRVRDARECSFAASFFAVADHIMHEHRGIWDRFNSSESGFKNYITEVLKDTVPDFSYIDDSGIKLQRRPAGDIDDEEPADKYSGRGVSSKGRRLQKQAKRRAALDAAEANMAAFTEHARRTAAALGIVHSETGSTDAESDDHFRRNDHSQRGLQWFKDAQTVKVLTRKLEGEQNKLSFFRSGQGGAPGRMAQTRLTAH